MSPPIKFSLRFIVYCILLMMVFSYFGESLVKPLLPVYKWQISKMADEYRIISLSLDNEGFERVIRLQITLTKPIQIGREILTPDIRGIAVASTSLSHIWQMSVVCLALVLALQARHLVTYFIRFTIAIPLLIIFSLLDTPLALLASLWNLILSNTASDAFSPLIVWDNFLEGGARFALGIVAGLLAVLVSHIVEKTNI